MPRRMTAIWKPTEYCNLACKYCYVSDNPQKDMMSLDTMRESLDELTGYVGKEGSLNVIIHGGEPMLWGMKNYEQMFAHVDKLHSEGYKIDLSMQTNGTLFTDAKKAKVDPFEEIIGMVMTNRPKGCHTLKSCQESFVGIEHDGGVSSCGRGGRKRRIIVWEFT